MHKTQTEFENHLTVINILFIATKKLHFKIYFFVAKDFHFSICKLLCFNLLYCICKRKFRWLSRVLILLLCVYNLEFILILTILKVNITTFLDLD